MSTAGDYRKVACPSCGAPITLTGAQAECQFCGMRIERSSPEIQVQLQWEPAAIDAAQLRSRTRRASLVIALAALILVGVTGLVIWLILILEEGTPGPPPETDRSYTVSELPLLVPSDRTGPADVLVLTYHSEDRTRTLTYLDGGNHTVQWDSPPLSENAYQAQVTLKGPHVYVVDQMTLSALNRTDGTRVWQATLADTLLSICEGCLRVEGDFVVVLSQDGTLHGFEAPTGRLAWSLRLNETPRNLWSIDGKIAVLDREDPEDYRSIALQLRDPATGEVVQRIPGTCSTDRGTGVMPIYSHSVLIGPDDAVYFLYGLMPACAQRWDPVTGQLVWQTIGEDHYFDRFNAPPVLAEGTIWGGYRDGSGNRVIALDTSSGDLRILTEEKDYELTPFAERDGILIVRARRTRGSERHELWGLDSSSGERKWQRLLGKEEPIEEPGSWSGPAYGARLTREGLFLLHLQTDPPQMAVEILDPQTGTGGAQVVNALEDDHWEGIVWSNSTAWVLSRKLYVVDLATGNLLYTWP